MINVLCSKNKNEMNSKIDEASKKSLIEQPDEYIEMINANRGLIKILSYIQGN